MKVVLGLKALREIHEIYLYIARDDRQAAMDVRDRLYRLFDHLAEHPYSAHATVLHNMRSIPASPYPYFVLFRVLPRLQEVRIIRVMHGARRRPALREEPAAFRHLAIS